MKKTSLHNKANTQASIDPSVISQIEENVLKTEQARDIAISATDTVYPDESTGRSSVTDGQYFRIAGDGIESVTRLYKRENSTTSTLVGEEPSAQFVRDSTENINNAGMTLANELPLIKSVMIGGKDLLDRNYHQSEQHLEPTGDLALNGLGYSRLFNYSLLRVYNNYGDNTGLLDVVKNNLFIHSYIMLDEGLTQSNGSPIISYRDSSNTSQVLRKSDSLNNGVIEVSPTVKVRWFLFNKITDIDTSRNLDFMVGTGGEKIINPAIFTFQGRVTPHIDSCDYLKSVDKKSVYGMKDLGDIFDKIDLLERQNSALRDWSEGKNLTKLSLGLTGFNYWSSVKPFIDHMKDSHKDWLPSSGSGVSPYMNISTGWIDQLPAGESVLKYVMIHVNAPNSVRTGKYFVTWTGGADVSVKSDAGVNSGGNLVSPNRYEITLLPAPDKSVNALPEQIILIVRNNTVNPLDVTDIKVFHEDDEADLLAGKVFQKDWLDYHRKSPVIRTMDLLHTNDSEVVNFEDFPSVTDCCWTGTGNKWHSIPPELIGVLGSELGCDIWVNTPHQSTRDCRKAMAQAIASTYPEGNIYVEYSNETWNSTFSVYNYLGNTLGPTVHPTGSFYEKVAWGTAKGAAESWEDFEQYFDRSRTKRVISGQFRVFDRFKTMFDYDYNGERVGDLMDLYGVAPYLSVSGGTGIVTDTSEAVLKEQKKYLEPLSWWEEGFANDLELIDLTLELQTQALKDLNPNNINLRITSYEVGHHLQVTRTYDYTFDVEVATNTLKIQGTSDLTGMFEDGEQIEMGYKVGGQEVINNRDHYTPRWIRLVGTDKLKLYMTEQDYIDDNPVSFNSGADSFQIVSNYTRQIALGDFYHNLVSTDFMVDRYKELISVCRKHKLEQFNQFVSLGGWSEGVRNFSWGLAKDLSDNNVRRKYYLDLQDKYFPEGMPPFVPES